MVQRHLSTKAILCQQLLQSEKSPRREVEPFQHYSKGVTLYPVRGFFFLLSCALVHGPTVAEGQ